MTQTTDPALPTAPLPTFAMTPTVWQQAHAPAPAWMAVAPLYALPIVNPS